MKVIVDGVQFDTDNVRIELDNGFIVQIEPTIIEIINPDNPTEPQTFGTQEAIQCLLAPE
jgi:hypothetical protein